MAITVGQLLARVLAAAGVDAVYGVPLAGVPVTQVSDRSVADLLAVAHGRVHRAVAAVHDADGRLHIGAGSRDEMTITHAADLLAVVGGPTTLRLALDPAGPAPDVVPRFAPAPERWLEPEADALARLAAATAPAVLAGPGVVAAGAVEGLNAFATAGDVGVLNTWGAKGVFHWRSRHHWATVGLQARDFELGGLASADLIVATGIDPDEAPGERWQLAPVVTVAPGALGPLSEQWHRPPCLLSVPPLHAGLAAVTQDGWTVTSAPLTPTRVTLHYGQVFGAGGLVAADPGVSGYWVARTFSTTVLGSAQVPARPGRGFSAACALVARLRQPARPVLAVVDGPMDAAVEAVLETAASLGVAVPVEIWRDEGPPLDADAHLQRLQHLAVSEHPAPVGLRTDDGQLARMIEVAGPVIAWGGI